MNETQHRAAPVAPTPSADADDAARLRVWIRVQEGMIEERRKRETRRRVVAMGVSAVGVLVALTVAVTGNLPSLLP